MDLHVGYYVVVVVEVVVVSSSYKGKHKNVEEIQSFKNLHP